MPPDAHPGRTRTQLRLMAGVFAACGSVPLAVVLLGGDASIWTVLYLLGFASVAFGCLMRQRKVRMVAAAGGALLLVVPIARATFVPGAAGEGVHPADARFVNAIYPEADGAIGTARFMHLMGLRMEHGGDPPLADALEDAYDRMERDVGDLPTPAISTYLGLQRPDSYDVVRFDGPAGSDTAVIFLHGFSGNFNVYCRHFAQAAKKARATTVCPSMGPSAQWWSPAGLQTTRSMLTKLRNEGFEHIYLAGLSNGAIGAGSLADDLQEDLAGLILLSGAPAGQVAPTGLPVLAVTGAADAMIPASYPQAYIADAVAAEPSTGSRYVEVPGGHFVFLSRHDEVGRAVVDWMADQAAGARSNAMNL